MHTRNPTVDWTSTAFYATLDIHHHLPCYQFMGQNSMDRVHTPALDRRLLVDRPYEEQHRTNFKNLTTRPQT
ncbi:hypothetical protein CEXT_241271 [Caerostris extrusa]|uniref:Uncharacterized protein n=1 Tax=Caerostris extrusa TaxID=172846 RepID=A0AAV4WK55_CAEEX|nr:hypothetical protein CEXT_241271 [Caerostris extrusa]